MVMQASKLIDNRETWLNRAMTAVAVDFKAIGKPLPEKIRLSVGFPLGGFEKIAGQCFKRIVSRDGTNEIFISPLVDDAVQALAILVHELIHAQDDCASGHNKAFEIVARQLRLEGKPTQTVAGSEFKRVYAPLLKMLGAYPHRALRPTKIKRQSTRLIKAECLTCGYVCRVTKKWILAAGAPVCPACSVQMVTDLEGDGE